MSERPLTADDLAQHIAILMAAHGRDAPILRGSRAPSPDQRDELRRAFARWLADAMIEGNLRVTLGPPTPMLR